MQFRASACLASSRTGLSCFLFFSILATWAKVLQKRCAFSLSLMARLSLFGFAIDAEGFAVGIRLSMALMSPHRSKLAPSRIVLSRINAALALLMVFCAFFCSSTYAVTSSFECLGAFALSWASSRSFTASVQSSFQKSRRDWPPFPKGIDAWAAWRSTSVNRSSSLPIFSLGIQFLHFSSRISWYFCQFAFWKAKRPFPFRCSVGAPSAIFISIGRWSEPIPRSVFQSTSRFAVQSEMSGTNWPPLAGFTLVCAPSFKRVSSLSTIHSSISRPALSSGWKGSRDPCALKYPQIMAVWGVGNNSKSKLDSEFGSVFSTFCSTSIKNSWQSPPS